ncbi:hypothetical protein AB0E01_37305 [Nocardia vinacea]|uniref:hypothetical protein n=1 Tax=Nocardia vinacea TaxID=96468 RepID=UPI0033CC661F
MPSFGIMTAPMHVDYHDVLRVWCEADTIPQIEHAWLFDHLMPIGGDPNGPTDSIGQAIDAGFRRIVLGLSAPDIARWVAAELISTST